MSIFDQRQSSSRTFHPGIAKGSTQPIPILLLLDTSTSMRGQPIAELNKALTEWTDVLKSDPFLRENGEIALISFGNGGVKIISGTSPDAAGAFDQVANFRAPRLEANGATPMIEAIRLAISLANDRRRFLRSHGILPHRPNVYMISDGMPTDNTGHFDKNWRTILPVLRESEQRRHLLFFALGANDTDEGMLRELAPEAYYKANGVPFSSILRMVSASSGSVGKSEDPQAAFRRIRQFMEQG